MATPETILSATQRHEQEQDFAENGIDITLRIAELNGFSGPALEAFNSGIDNIGQEVSQKSDMVDLVESAIAEAAEDTGVVVGEREARKLSIVYVVAHLAFRDMPIFLSPDYSPNYDDTPEDRSMLDMIKDFYTPLAEAHPELVDGDVVNGEIPDPGDAMDLNDRVASKLGEEALLMELEKIYPDSAHAIIGKIEKAIIPELIVDPVPQEVIADTLAVNALEYNHNYFAVV